MLLADRDVEIVADRGFNGRVSADGMAGRLRDRWKRGSAPGIMSAAPSTACSEAGRLLARHYPPLPGGRDEDELPNWPAVL